MIALLVGLGFAGYRWLRTSDTALIQMRIQELAKDASIDGEVQGVQLHTRAVQATKHFSPAFSGQLDLKNGQTHSIPSKQEAVQSFSAAFYVLKPMRISASGLEISVHPGANKAEARLTVDLQHSSASLAFDRAKLQLKLVKNDGEWLIERADGAFTPNEK